MAPAVWGNFGRQRVNGGDVGDIINRGKGRLTHYCNTVLRIYIKQGAAKLQTSSTAKDISPASSRPVAAAS